MKLRLSILFCVIFSMSLNALDFPPPEYGADDGLTEAFNKLNCVDLITAEYQDRVNLTDSVIAHTKSAITNMTAIQDFKYFDAEYLLGDIAEMYGSNLADVGYTSVDIVVICGSSAVAIYFMALGISSGILASEI